MTTVLLARVAESLFWVGRYIERAEGTARILDVVVHRALEEQGEGAGLLADRLLGSMGLVPTGRPELAEVTQRLTFDRESGSSIAGALSLARDNARAVRHVLPSELWERLNSTWVGLRTQEMDSRVRGPSGFLSWVKSQTAAVTGLADTTMSRDQTWLFFTLGRSLERADMTARLLGTVALDDLNDSGLVTLLRSCGGHEPYLRRARGVVDAEGVVGFLLMDPLFPRSVLCSLTVAARCIDDLGGSAPSWDEARGLVGMARAELEFLAPQRVLHGLPARLIRLHDACSEASDAVARRYFSQGPPTQWRTGRAL